MYVIYKMQIFVKTIDGNTITLNVWENTMVEHIKAMVQEHEGISPDRQRLVFAGTELTDGLTLHSYGIQNESTLEFYDPEMVDDVPFKLQVSFKKSSFLVDISTGHTIHEVKLEIEIGVFCTYVKAKDMKLFHGDEELIDSHKLQHYNINETSTLCLHIDESQPSDNKDSKKTEIYSMSGDAEQGHPNKHVQEIKQMLGDLDEKCSQFELNNSFFRANTSVMIGLIEQHLASKKKASSFELTLKSMTGFTATVDVKSGQQLSEVLDMLNQQDVIVFHDGVELDVTKTFEQLGLKKKT